MAQVAIHGRAGLEQNSRFTAAMFAWLVIATYRRRRKMRSTTLISARSLTRLRPPFTIGMEGMSWSPMKK